MLAWSMRARACRSASNRATTWAESRPGLMSLRATRRRTGCSCSAMKTTPMPPSPICCNNLYGPTRDPGRSVTGSWPAVGPATASAAGRRRNSHTRPSVANRPSTSPRRPASAPDAASRYAARSAADSISRARPKMDFTSGGFGVIGRSPVGGGWLYPPMRRAGPKAARKNGNSSESDRRRAFALQAAEQPDPGVGPDGVGLAGRHPEHRGRLFDGQPGEVVQLDQLGRLRVRGRELLQRLVHGDDVLERAGDGGAVSGQRRAAQPAAALAAGL